MHLRRSLTLLLAPALALSTPATWPARAGEPPKSLEIANPNAALRYWAAWAVTGPDVLEKAAAIDWAAIGKELDGAKMPKEFKDAAALDSNDAVNLLLVAAGTDRCDFELRYDAGVELLLPHLSKMRASARLLRLDARKHLLAGDADAAARRVVAIERMAGHLAGDRTLISSLVAYAIASLGFAETEALLASGKLSDDSRAALVAALRALDTADPMGTRAALAFEKQTVGNWIRRRYTGPNAGRDLAEFCTATMADGPAEVHAAALAALDGEALGAEIDRMGAAFDDTLAAWDGPEPESRLDELAGRIAAGDYGHLAGVMAPATSKVYGAAGRFRAELRATIEKVSGSAAPGNRPAAPASKSAGGR